MAFTIEDGTGIANANSYMTVAEADAYFDDRNRSGGNGWQGDDGTKEFALIKASDWIDKRFAKRFIGRRCTLEQGLEWPRDDAVDFNGIEWAEIVPPMLKQATAEYAARALESELVTDPIQPPNLPAQGPLTYLRNRVEGAVEQEQRWADNTAGRRLLNAETVNEQNIPEYPEADLLVERLLKSVSGGFVRRA